MLLIIAVKRIMRHDNRQRKLQILAVIFLININNYKWLKLRFILSSSSKFIAQHTAKSTMTVSESCWLLIYFDVASVLSGRTNSGKLPNCQMNVGLTIVTHWCLSLRRYRYRQSFVGQV